MIGRKTFIAAYLLDWIAGDPEWLPHPVRLIGKSVEEGERLLRRPGQAPDLEFATGSALTFGLVAATYMGTRKTITWMSRQARSLGLAADMLLAWTCLASRSLHDEASIIIAALEADDIVLARRQLTRIVGRDTMHLDASEICRAVIETVAESCSDGVIAPLFYMAIGGVPLSMAYKTINTLDSMIGHTNKQYFYFGKTAARLDDMANLLPSRLTALGIAAAANFIEGAAPVAALTSWLSDGMKHRSPNAGQPESAMAGALQVCLGGKNFYNGEPVCTPRIGERFLKPSPQQAKRAIRLVAVVSFLGALAMLMLGERKR